MWSLNIAVFFLYGWFNCSPQSSLPVPWPFWELRGCTVEDSRFYKADLDLQLQLIADVLIVQPVSKRRFGVDNLFNLLRQSLALIVDDNTVFCKNEGSSQRRTEYFLLWYERQSYRSLSENDGGGARRCHLKKNNSRFLTAAWCIVWNKRRVNQWN